MDLKNKINELYRLNNNKYEKPLTRKIVRLLKIVLVDEEKDINKILELVPIGLLTIKNYISDGTNLLKYLTKEEYIIFKEKIQEIIDYSTELQRVKQEEFIKNAIIEIFETRHTIDRIALNNYLPKNKLVEIINNKDYIEQKFGIGTYDKLKIKITENVTIRNKTKRDINIIEDKNHILLAKPNILYLDQIDFRKLSLASSYIFSDADKDYIEKKYDLEFLSVIVALNNPKIAELIKEEYYTVLKNCINIEMVLLGNNLIQKQKLLFETVNFLNENNFDIELTTKQFKLPINLLKRILLEALKVTYIDGSIKEQIKFALSPENGVKKVK